VEKGLNRRCWNHDGRLAPPDPYYWVHSTLVQTSRSSHNSTGKFDVLSQMPGAHHNLIMREKHPKNAFRLTFTCIALWKI